jgi:four helix bundle protein
MRNDRENIIVEKTLAFSLLIIRYCNTHIEEKKFIVANQLLRSSTSIGANVFEAQNAESKADFIHKMKVAAKEASESLYWVTLCEKSEGYNYEEKYKNDLEDIIRILSRKIATSKQELPFGS